jgi:hypothetical protein
MKHPEGEEEQDNEEEELDKGEGNDQHNGVEVILGP